MMLHRIIFSLFVISFSSVMSPVDITTRVSAQLKTSTAPQNNSPVLLNVVDTAAWSDPSPDPTGITFWREHRSLLLVDSEVDEMPDYFTGKNVFQSTLSGDQISSASFTAYSVETSGVSLNPSNGHIFISDDDIERVFEIDPGSDRLLGTPDDSVTFINTSAFGSEDPEEVAYGEGELFILDSTGSRVYRLNPGSNHIFDGIPPVGDDRVTSFNTAGLMTDYLQGIEFNPYKNTLFLAGGANKDVLETTLNGAVVKTIDISFLGAVDVSDIALGPSSQVAYGALSLYILDRGIDNEADPLENDGKIYEITYDEVKLSTFFMPLVAR